PPGKRTAYHLLYPPSHTRFCAVYGPARHRLLPYFSFRKMSSLPPDYNPGCPPSDPAAALKPPCSPEVPGTAGHNGPPNPLAAPFAHWAGEAAEGTPSRLAPPDPSPGSPG